MQIICYAGGTCGDLVTSVIDSSDSEINIRKHFELSAERSRLKKPHLFQSDVEKLQFLDDISSQYLSIPSHDLDFHSRYAHNFIGITVQDKEIAYWAAERFKNLHRPHVWEEMTRYCGASTVEAYAQTLIDFSNLISTKTNQLIRLEDIVNGNLVDQLSNFIKTPLNNELYQQWLTAQFGKTK